MYYIYFILICHWTDNKENKQKSDHEKKKEQWEKFKKKITMDHFEYKVEIKRLQLLFQDKLFPHVYLCVFLFLWSCEMFKKSSYISKYESNEEQEFLLCPF